MSRWYRAYEGTVTDPKLGEVALVAGCSRSVAIATWHAILEDCASSNDGGRYETTPRRVAVVLGEPVAIIEGVFAEMEALGLIGAGRVAAWTRRQFESDNSTERSRRHRETRRNADATSPQRCATPPETESETDTESSSESERPTISREPAAPSAEASLRVAIAGAYSAAGSPTVPDTSRAAVWLARGWPPDLCVAAIREGLERRGSAPRSLAYFEPAIRDRIADGAPPDASARAPPRRPPRTMTEALNRRDAHDEPARDPKIIDAIAVSG